MSAPLPEVEGYRVLALLGEGGVGRVFLAETRTGRRVALKLLHERRDLRGHDLRRQIREARVGSTLQHPHILPVLAVEPWRDSLVIVMEYVDGEPLRPWRAGSEPAGALGGRVLSLASIADALALAHARGVVHRDVKPGNILVRRDGHPFLIDFGLARTIAVDTTVTATGSILGTPAYLPPEIVAGEQRLDPRSDLYALGATLYEVAAGAPPFQAEHLPELLRRILHEEPPRLPATTPQARVLEPIVRRALEKRPEDRYAGAAEMREDLLRAARGLRPRTSQASLWVRRELRGLVRRRVQIAMALVLLLALLAGGLFVGLRTLERTRQREDLLRSGYARLDRGELEDALADFARVDELAARGWEGQLARADAFAEFQMWERARAELAAASDLGYRFGDDDPTAGDLFLRGLARFADHRYAESEADLRRALELDPDQYRAYFVVSRLLLRQERRAEARAVLETCRRNLKAVHPRHAAVSSAIHLLAGEHAAAVALLRPLADAPDPPVWVHGLLGVAHLASYHEGAGETAELAAALDELGRAVALQPGDGHSWSQLGVAQFLDGRADEARRSAERALELDPRLEPGQRLLAILAAERGDWGAAERHLAAFAEETALGELASRLRAQVAFELGHASYREGRFATALEQAQRCVELWPAHLGGWLLSAQSHWLLGQPEPARTSFAECRQRLDAWRPPAESWEPWVRSCEDVRRHNALDVEIGLLGTTVQIERPPGEDELALARSARARLEEALLAGAALAPASTLNLAEALATGRVAELCDCDLALELVDSAGLRAALAGRPSSLETLERIERACR